MSLLLVLGACLLSAAYIRWPWKRHQTGLILIHTGLLLILAGSCFNYWSGIEGTIELSEGESTDQLALDGRCQITASWANRPQEPPYVFTFESGPVDWNGSTAIGYRQYRRNERSRAELLSARAGR